MSDNSPALDLTIPDFGPEGILVDLAFAYPPDRPNDDPEAPAVVSVGLNPNDMRVVSLDVQPAGEAELARDASGMQVNEAIWLDLGPAEALLLADRLRVCAEAAARFAEAYPEPDEIDESDRQTIEA
jgi:hypothetical protein